MTFLARRAPRTKGVLSTLAVPTVLTVPLLFPAAGCRLQAEGVHERGAILGPVVFCQAFRRRRLFARRCAWAASQ